MKALLEELPDNEIIASGEEIIMFESVTQVPAEIYM